VNQVSIKSVVDGATMDAAHGGTGEHVDPATIEAYGSAHALVEAAWRRQIGFLERLPEHAEVLTGGQQARDSGVFFEPTGVSNLAQTDEVIQQEVFGPVITVHRFAHQEDAIQRANDVEFGLASSVWIQDHARALRVSAALDFGCVWINTHSHLVAGIPHRGFKHSLLRQGPLDVWPRGLHRVKHVMSANS
jgi:betaine-aldehyde dehydrogenase